MRLSNSYTVIRVAVQHTEAVPPAHGMTYGSNDFFDLLPRGSKIKKVIADKEDLYYGEFKDGEFVFTDKFDELDEKRKKYVVVHELAHYNTGHLGHDKEFYKNLESLIRKHKISWSVAKEMEQVYPEEWDKKKKSLFANADDLDYYEIRGDAQELAASRGYEGDVFYRGKDENLGEIKYVKINLSEDNLGIWLAEVSDVNGCESFRKWDEQSQEFYNEHKKSKKSKNKNKNRFANAGDPDDCGQETQTGRFKFDNTCAEGSGQDQEESADTAISGPDPVEVEKNLSSLYKKAPHVKDEIDSLAEHITTKEDRGSYVIKAPLKSKKRSLEKCINDYGGDVSRMKDIARNTIAAPDEIHENVIVSLRKMGASVRVIDCEDDPMGYSGVNSSLKTEHGMYGEIQVNSPEMIFAKEPPNIAKAILGEEKWEEIANSTGAEGGLGHHYYEEYRSLPPGDPRRDHLEKKSRDYYNSIRGGC